MHSPGYHAPTELNPAGGGPAPHTHANEDELYIVLEGTLSFFSNDRWTDVGPGGLVYHPRGSLHTFKNKTSSATKAMILTTPAGFERLLAEVSAACPPGQLAKRLLDVSAKHGIVYPGMASPT